jgi:hypothetical protein
VVFYRQYARLVASAGAVVGAQLDVQTQAASTVGEQLTVCEADQLAGELATRKSETQLRPDTGRLA